MPQRYEIITTKLGQTILARLSNGVRMKPVSGADGIVSVQPFEATHDEFVALLHKSRTHNLSFDHKARKVIATPKAPKQGKGGVTGNA